MKCYIPIYIILLCCNPVFGQKSKIRRANDVFQKQNYSDAILLYSEITERKDTFPLHYRLAYSAMKMGDFELAYDAFQNIKDEFLPDVYYNYDYTNCLIALGKYKEAKQQIAKYFSHNKYYSYRYIDFVDEIANETDTEMIFSEVERKLIFSDKYSYNEYGNSLDKSVFFYQNDLVIDSHLFYDFKAITEKHLLFEAQFNRRFDFSPHQFTSSQKKTIISSYLIIRNPFGKIDPNLRSKLYECEQKNDTYEIIKGLSINSNEYDVASPSLNVTGDTLYFSSNMPVGFGGYDLYYITYNNEIQMWENPVNLGPAINTEYDEKYPFYHQNSYQLYFSSEGHPSYGLADIYVINPWKVGEERNFPINLGSDINTNQDDFGFILNAAGTIGFVINKEKGINKLYEISIKK
jgi:hypothetical protein